MQIRGGVGNGSRIAPIRIRLKANEHVVFRIGICEGAQIGQPFIAIFKEAALKCQRHSSHSTDSLLLASFGVICKPLCFGEGNLRGVLLNSARAKVCGDTNDGEHHDDAGHHAEVHELTEQTLAEVLETHAWKIVDANGRGVQPQACVQPL